MKVKDPEADLIERLIREVPVTSSYDDDPETSQIRKAACDRFPVIESADDPCADFLHIRERMKSAAKVSDTWRGSVGFIEVSIQDMLKHDCIVHGRNFMLPECGIGVHDAVHPLYGTKDGRTFTKHEREENRKRCCRLIGCNANGAGTGKALLAATCLKLGIRCILNVGDCVVVDSWPDYKKDYERLTSNYCAYTYS